MMTKLEQAARRALEAFPADSNQEAFRLGYAKGVDDAERRAKARGEQPAAPTQDPAAWAITYDGRTPHTLWHEGDGPLLDLEIKRQGGSAQKMALYTAPQPSRQPLPPASPCAMTEAEYRLFKLGWLEAEAAHGIT